MYCNTWKVAFAEQLVELSCTQSALDKDNDLIEFEFVKKVIELSVLLAFIKLDVVLL